MRSRSLTSATRRSPARAPTSESRSPHCSPWRAWEQTRGRFRRGYESGSGCRPSSPSRARRLDLWNAHRNPRHPDRQYPLRWPDQWLSGGSNVPRPCAGRSSIHGPDNHPTLGHDHDRRRISRGGHLQSGNLGLAPRCAQRQLIALHQQPDCRPAIRSGVSTGTIRRALFDLLMVQWHHQLDGFAVHRSVHAGNCIGIPRSHVQVHQQRRLSRLVDRK